MVRRVFPAEVTNGQIRFQESLSDLEGRRVWVTLLDGDDATERDTPQTSPEHDSVSPDLAQHSVCLSPQTPPEHDSVSPDVVRHKPPHKTTGEV